MPRLLDLFSGAGGCAMGYSRAGFDDITGVDVNPQPRYPFKFVQADALEYAARHGHEYDAIHASPPCQAYSKATAPLRAQGREYPRLIEPTRILLQTLRRPWVIENVPGAPIRRDYVLCGCMTGLPRLKRERWFEVSWPAAQLRAPCHHPEPVISVVGHDVPSEYRRKHGRVTLATRRAVMGIDWMSRDELAEAIPPAYTEYVGAHLILTCQIADTSPAGAPTATPIN